MKDNRPVNLDIGTMRLPVTAWASISHRISGVILIPVMIALVWALGESLESRASFEALVELLGHPVSRVILWGLLVAFIYHTVAGIRHLIMDCGVGESLRGGVIGARLVFVLTIVLAAAAGVWLW